MNDKIKKGQIIFTSSNPMEVIEVGESIDAEYENVEHSEKSKIVGSVVKEYLKATERFLKGKLKHLNQYTPDFLANPGSVLVVICNDGVVIRYEKKHEAFRVLVTEQDESIAKFAFLLSQHMVRIFPDQKTKDEAEPAGIELKLTQNSPSRNASKELTKMLVGFSVILDDKDKNISLGQKPFCLLSVRNMWEFVLTGELLSEGQEKLGEGTKFISRTEIRLPVGWDCIEVYPEIDLDHWKKEYVESWAEKDILAAVVTNRIVEDRYKSLDPNAEARREFSNILKKFKELLDSNPGREEILQSFLKEHPTLLCPTYTKVWPKLPFGGTVSDFVFRDATNEYLLVELERSTHKLFRGDGHLRSEVITAQGQISDWKRYIEDNKTTVQRELGLNNISSNPNSLIVIGRSDKLTEKNRRKLATIQNQNPKDKIYTYDDVYDNAKAVIENLLGPIWETTGDSQVYYPLN